MCVYIMTRNTDDFLNIPLLILQFILTAFCKSTRVIKIKVGTLFSKESEN
jgi:hypothetical protein